MSIFNILTMAGGLALFLYGMHVMGDALSKLAGGRLEQILERMTSNSVKAVMMGALVTAVIQSSTAATVMVVGFVNSGIMKLTQAVGVIMGANIGTTLTSWMLSLTGIESGSLFINLLKPSSFAPVLGVIGIIFIMFLKDSKKKDIGTIFLGFSILMFGMETMSDSVKPLAEVKEFTSIFTAFENPLLGMLAGAVLTAIIQSSSASVGILQAVCTTGSVTIGAAIPVIMGQNIGTCITALLSGAGAGRNAKRASLIHLYFNVIGTALFMVLYYGANAVFKFGFASKPANGASIAVIHSIFNVLSTLILLPAAGIIVRLSYLSIPKTEDEKEENAEKENKIPDDRILRQPSFAAAQCRNVVCDMALLIKKSIELCRINHELYEEKNVSNVIRIEELVDINEDEMSSYLCRLSEKSMSIKDRRMTAMLGKCIINFERISDYAKGIVLSQKKLMEADENYMVTATEEMMPVFDAMSEIVENTVYCFINKDSGTAVSIATIAEVILIMKKDIRKNNNKSIKEGRCSVDLGMRLNDLLTSIERIARHCCNIAEEVVASDTDEYDFHRYARSLKEENETYKELLYEYIKKYNVNINKHEI